MPKASKQTTRNSQARKTARLLLQRRTELSLLVTKTKTGRKLTEREKIQARSLIVRIRNLKTSLEEMGLNVDEAINWAKEDQKNNARGKRSKEKMRSGNGVGMYSLGTSIKTWR